MHAQTILNTAWVLAPLLAGAFLLILAVFTRREDGPGREPAFYCVASCLAFGAALIFFLRT